jgi:hypothetical protein
MIAENYFFTNKEDSFFIGIYDINNIRSYTFTYLFMNNRFTNININVKLDMNKPDFRLFKDIFDFYHNHKNLHNFISFFEYVLKSDSYLNSIKNKHNKIIIEI